MALDAEQIERLREALNRATGKEVEVKVVVDPSRARRRRRPVGDVVIDGPSVIASNNSKSRSR